jgi:hypothetical protein
VSPANLNSPGQIVIAGATAAVARAGERAKALGAKRVIPLTVSAPFHCALMKPAELRLAPELRALTTRDPRVPVVANVDAEPRYEAAASIEALIRQVSAPVRWEDSVRRLASDGVTAYVEVGPGTVLSDRGARGDRSRLERRTGWRPSGPDGGRAPRNVPTLRGVALVAVRRIGRAIWNVCGAGRHGRGGGGGDNAAAMVKASVPRRPRAGIARRLPRRRWRP